MGNGLSSVCTAFVLALAIVAATGCEPAPTAAEHLSAAERYAAAGQHDLAIAELSRAVALEPAHSGHRLRLAELYLAAGNGSLAEATATQARQRGAPAEHVERVRFEALLLQGQNNELIDMPVDPAFDAETRLALDWARVRARSRLPSFASDEAELTAYYMEMLERAAGLATTPTAQELVERLDALRTESAEAERAWQHFHCRNASPETVRWKPLEAGERRVLRVGPEREFATPAAAAQAAVDGDLVEFDEGHYAGGVALWPQNDLVVRGAGGGAVVTAAGRSVQERDVWLFTGDDVVVENVAISGARSRFRNGAGIRFTGANLTLRNVYLHDNENGLLTDNRRPESVIVIEHCEFARNGSSDGKAHNLYVGRALRLEMRFSYSHDVSAGHLVKSRTRENVIAYNRISDGEAGASSMLIDIPEGGEALILGNVLQQGYATQNNAMISFAAESATRHDRNRIVIAYNTIYNRHHKAVLLRNQAGADALLANNLLAGAEVTYSDGGAERRGNLALPEHGMRDPREFDFSLLRGAAAIDAAAATDIVPQFEYVHPRGGRVRARIATPDIGAYERCGL